MESVMVWLAAIIVSAIGLNTQQLGDQPLLRKEFVYKQVGNRKLVLFATTPKKWKPTDTKPAIVFFHGGGWTGGKPGQFDKHAKYFASRGMVCFQVQYRLLDKSKPTQTPESCIHDAKSAIRWIRQNKEKFGIDPQRIASAGGSAGGHLAAAVGMIDGVNDSDDDLTIPAKSNAMILFNPVFDNGPGGWGVKRVGKRFPEFSPMHNISKDDPPMIVFLGSNDKLIPVETVERFADKMKAVKVRCEFKIYDGKGHGFFNHGRGGNEAYLDTVERSDKFLSSIGWLSGKPTVRSDKNK